ncbi:MAG: outer membrane beta-barrel protein [Pseudomonadota bacterium]
MVLLLLFSTAPGAEAAMYAGLYGTPLLPDGETSSGVVVVSRNKVSESDFGDSFGVRLGGWLKKFPYLAAEGNFWYGEGEVGKRYAHTAQGEYLISNADYRAFNLSASLLAQYPKEEWRPYIGAGLLYSWAWLDSSIGGLPGGKDSNVGLVAQAGVDYQLTECLNIFGEYRYARTEFNFAPGAETAVSTHHLLVGAELRW